jgi:lipoprotein-anchoring transpeptidase ErfK/SrfK
LLGVFICLVLAWLAWQGVQPVAAFFSSSAFTGQEHGPAWSQVNIAKPVLTPNSDGIVAVPTATELTPADSTPTGIVSTEITPTATPVPQTETPASVAVVMPTDTPLVQPTIQQAVVIQPTATSSPLPLPSPTENIPAPTLPPAPTATLAAIATAAPGSTLVADAGASPTPLPTDTGVPFATPKAPGSSMAASAPGTGHWVDVDLTNQMVYAYDGNTVVNSFLVSTGTWAHPTVTGQYHVYVKYRYTDMSGPGYYLPNVPFTMYFYQGYALHGTYWHSNFGTPMSHGCVNLSIPDSEWLYNFSSVGTLVNVHY